MQKKKNTDNYLVYFVQWGINRLLWHIKAKKKKLHENKHYKVQRHRWYKGNVLFGLQGNMQEKKNMQEKENYIFIEKNSKKYLWT